METLFLGGMQRLPPGNNVLRNSYQKNHEMR